MGISGLLPALKSIQCPTDLSKYKGKTLAVDTYAWLHKAAFGCSLPLVEDQPTRVYINYILRRLKMMEHFGIKAYMVFDGDHLPSKAMTEKERRVGREENRAKALEALAQGDKRAAWTFARKAVDITPGMAKSLIEEFKRLGVSYVVAPYEADSQMVYLEQVGLVDGILSEDSDLLIFGCQTLITKLKDNGQCIEVSRSQFGKCKTDLSVLDQDQLRLMAIISGCDYTKGIPGLGVLKAAALVRKFKTFKRVMMAIQFEATAQIPDTFQHEYVRACVAFQHPVVWDPLKGCIVHLHPLPPVENRPFKDEDLVCTGQILDQQVHQGIARGDLDPFTKKQLHPRDSSSAPAALPVRMAKSTSVSIFGRQSNTLDTYKAKRTYSTPNVAEVTTTEATTIKTHSLYVSRKNEIRKKTTMRIDQFFEKRTKSLDGGSNRTVPGEESKFFKKKKPVSSPDRSPVRVFSSSQNSNYDVPDPDSPVKERVSPVKDRYNVPDPDSENAAKPVKSFKYDEKPHKRKPLADITNNEQHSKVRRLNMASFRFNAPQ